MTANNLTYFLRTLNLRAERESEKGTEVLFSVSIVNDNKSQKVIDNEPVESMTKQVKQLIKTEKPEMIKVDLISESGRWIDGNVCDLRDKTTPIQNFQGFGEAEISSMVEKRLQEIKREDEFKEMKEIIKELANENETLKIRVTELEEENQELEESLESKTKVRYYTGMLGDILESFGISKDRIKKPLAELMGINDKDEKEKLPASTDESGIVDENGRSLANEKKRAEVIDTICDYLHSLNNQVLGEMFTIFSEVESNHPLAADIIEYLQKRKEFTT